MVQSTAQQDGITQPYYNENQQYNQYNQVAPTPIGSDVRIEQPYCEKPV